MTKDCAPALLSCPQILVKDATKSFSGRVVVDVKELLLGERPIEGLIGPNGAGKTTTMKLLLGLLFPTSGQALVFGRDASEVNKNERIGYVRSSA